MLLIRRLVKVIREEKINRYRLLYHEKHPCLVFVDDVVMLTREEQELGELVKNWILRKKMGLYTNKDKSIYMERTNKSNYVSVQK